LSFGGSASFNRCFVERRGLPEFFPRGLTRKKKRKALLDDIDEATLGSRREFWGGPR